jgi:hypothetical protein
MGRACSTHRERNAYKISVGKPEGRGSVGRYRHRWEDDFQMDLRETEWIDLAQDRNNWRIFVNTVINLRIP